MTISDCDFNVLARCLSDEAGNTIPLHALRTRRCRAWIKGLVDSPNALVLAVDYIPNEPYVFGHDAAVAVAMIAEVPGWKCVNVSVDLADAMTRAMTAATGKTIARHADIYFAQTHALRIPAHPRVRFLTPADAALLSAAHPDASPGSPQFVDRLLREGYCTAAILDGRVVAQTHAYCITDKYAEIGAKTAADYRHRGLSTACAGMLCARLFEEGKIPVWSTFETNIASQRVAEKLGFSKVTERVYLRTE